MCCQNRKPFCPCQILYTNENRLQKKWRPGRETCLVGGQGEEVWPPVWLWTQVAALGPGELCSLCPTNPHSGHSSAPEREARHRPLPKHGALLLSQNGTGRAHTAPPHLCPVGQTLHCTVLCTHLPSVRQKPKAFLKGHFHSLWSYLFMTLLSRMKEAQGSN